MASIFIVQDEYGVNYAKDVDYKIDSGYVIQRIPTGGIRVGATIKVMEWPRTRFKPVVLETHAKLVRF